MPIALAGVVFAASPAVAAYQLHNLVSDQTGAADQTDADLVNSWGVAFNPNGFVWVVDNATGKSTLYDGLGSKQTLVVSIPGAAGANDPGKPTGIVFNDGDDFHVNLGLDSGPAAFIFAGEDGVISAWSPAVPPPAPSTQALRVVDNSASGAIYKGLARANNGGSDFLYATDFHNSKIDAFTNAFTPATLPGNFTDPTLPAGFAPFGIQAIGNQLFVTYAMQDDNAEDDVRGPGLGYVDVFDLNGSLVKRLVSQGALNAPWGLAAAPSNFGEFSNALLVGNFGDGRINAYDPSTGNLLGTLSAPGGAPITIDGLWGMQFGNGVNSQPTSTLFVAAGPDDESHGLYASVSAVPEPEAAGIALVLLAGAAMWRAGPFAVRRVLGGNVAVAG